MNFINKNLPDQQQFIACFLNHKNWKGNSNLWHCNLNQMNLAESEKWLEDKDKPSVLIPFNCKYSPNLFTKMYVNYKLSDLFKTKFE